MIEMLKAAKAAKSEISALTTEQKNNALLAMADSLITYSQDILDANAQDIARAKDTISPVMLDRPVLSKDMMELEDIKSEILPDAVEGLKVFEVVSEESADDDI